MVDQYASFREKLPSSTFTVTAANGGQLATAGTAEVQSSQAPEFNSGVPMTLNFYLQLVNRAGRNLLSDFNSVTYSAGQKIVLTINASAISSGEEAFYILISASPDTSSNAQQLARWVAREANQTTKRSLPTTIEFTRDAHLVRGGIVADLNSLPTGSERISGMVREVTSEQSFYIYDSELEKWLPYPQGFNTYLESTINAGGSDRPLNEVRGALRAPPLIGGGDSTPVRVWWLNGYTESGAALPKGKRFNLRFAVDKSLIASNGLSYSEIFSGLVKVSSPGYVRRSTGVIDTTPMQSQLVWSGYYTPLTLPLDLPPGYAVAWDIVTSFSLDQLRGYLKEGSEIEIDLVEVPEAGIPSPLHAIYGNVILNNPDYFYIVPNRRKKGKAIVGGYQAGSEVEQVLVGLTADTPNQQCIINGAFNGEIFVRQQGETIFATESLRAIVSTEAGMGKTTTPISVTLNATGAIEVVVTHPNTIRSDYPDEIAGISCQVNVPHLRVFVVTQTGILRRNDPVSVGTASTTVLISELSVFTPIQTIVSIGNDFCLFAPVSVTATAKTVGSVSAGTYQILIAYEYPSPNYIITKISHSTLDGCLERLMPPGDMKKSTYDTNGDGKVDSAAVADAVTGIEQASSRSYYGKDASGQSGFFEIAADMLKSDYDSNSDGIVDSADSIQGINEAANSTYWGKNETGAIGFFDLPFFGSGGTGDMTKSVYDINNNGVVDSSEKIAGVETASNSTFYGKNSSGTVGFHTLPNSTGNISTTDSNSIDFSGIGTPQDPLTASLKLDSTGTATTSITSQGLKIDLPALSGEANTASNVGTIGEGIFKQKTGVDLEFKKLKQGGNITLTSDADSVIISSTASDVGGDREKLTANRTYYVRTTDGNDANDGLANTAGGAFKTIQRADDLVSDTLDIGIYHVKIKVERGTYTEKVTLKQCVGSGTVTIEGDTSDPSAVTVINPNPSAQDSGAIFVNSMITTKYFLRFLNISGGNTTQSPAYGINILAPCLIDIARVNLGNSGGSCLIVASQGCVEISDSIGFYNTDGYRNTVGISCYDEGFIRTAPNNNSHSWGGLDRLNIFCTAERGGSILLTNINNVSGTPITSYSAKYHGRIFTAGIVSIGGNIDVSSSTFGLLTQV